MKRSAISYQLSALAVLAAVMASSGFAQKQKVTIKPAQPAEVVLQKDTSYLGVGVQDVDADRAKALKMKEDHGAELTSVEPDSPAAKAGLKPGDVILEYNGTAVQSMEHLQRLVRETTAGRAVKLVVWRNGATVNLTATVGQRKGLWMEIPGGGEMVPVPPMPPMPPSMPRMITIMPSGRLGIDGEALNEEPQFAEFMGVKDGVLVKSVMRNSAAEKAGIKAGDVIVKIDDTHVSSSSDITSTFRMSHGKNSFNLTLVRNKKEMTLAVNL